MLCKTGIDTEIGERLGEYLGLTADKLPMIMISHFTGDDLDKYYFNQDVTAENVEKFVQDFKDKKLVKTLLSEDVPADSE